MPRRLYAEGPSPQERLTDHDVDPDRWLDPRDTAAFLAAWNGEPATATSTNR